MAGGRILGEKDESAIKAAFVDGMKSAGKEKRRLEVAQNLLREKLPVELVAKGTGLSIEEVKQLASGLTD